MKLREAGLTYTEIGEKMGFSNKRAWQLVCDEFKLLAATRAERAEDVLRLELARLDAMYKAVHEKAIEGDLKSINTALKIVDKRADLLGLKTIKQELKVEVNREHDVTARIAEYAAELERLLGTESQAFPSSLEGDGGRKCVDQTDADAHSIPVSELRGS